MSSGHSWKAPELERCELCGDKDWMADKYCAKNPKVAEQRKKWMEREHRTKLANDLERYNLWRRGAEDIEQPNPTKLGILIDEVVEELRK